MLKDYCTFRAKFIRHYVIDFLKNTTEARIG